MIQLPFLCGVFIFSIDAEHFCYVDSDGVLLVEGVAMMAQDTGSSFLYIYIYMYGQPMHCSDMPYLGTVFG